MNAKRDELMLKIARIAVHTMLVVVVVEVIAMVIIIIIIHNHNNLTMFCNKIILI